MKVKVKLKWKSIIIIQTFDLTIRISIKIEIFSALKAP